MSKIVDIDNTDVNEVVDEINGREVVKEVQKERRLQKVKTIAKKVAIPVGTFILGVVATILCSKAGEEQPQLPEEKVTLEDGTEVTIF